MFCFYLSLQHGTALLPEDTEHGGVLVPFELDPLFPLC